MAWQATARKLLQGLFQKRLASPFLQPVDAEALQLHDYSNIVKNPMDLGTVYANLAKGHYKSMKAFLSDVDLVFANALLYNPEQDPVYQAARNLRHYVQRQQEHWDAGILETKVARNDSPALKSLPRSSPEPESLEEEFPCSPQVHPPSLDTAPLSSGSQSHKSTSFQRKRKRNQIVAASNNVPVVSSDNGSMELDDNTSNTCHSENHVGGVHLDKKLRRSDTIPHGYEDSDQSMSQTGLRVSFVNRHDTPPLPDEDATRDTNLTLPGLRECRTLTLDEAAMMAQSEEEDEEDDPDYSPSSFVSLSVNDSKEDKVPPSSPAADSSSSSSDSSPISRRLRRLVKPKDGLRGHVSVCLSNNGSSSSGHTTTGYYRSVNQDAFCNCRFGNLVITGVFDGHGCLGEVASSLCARLIPAHVAALVHAGTNVETSLISSIQDTNKLLLSVAKSEASLVAGSSRNLATQRGPDYGTTASFAVIDEQAREAWVANIGDSRVLMISRTSFAHGSLKVVRGGKHLRFKARGKHRFCQLTSDHNPTKDPQERLRVEKSGGTVFYAGGDLRVMPSDMKREEARRRCLTLNMSRAMGHCVLSRYGISPEPQLTRFVLPSSLKAGDCFLLAASDGVWDVMSNEEVVDFAVKFSDPSEACEQILKECDTRWKSINHGDNITCVIHHL